MSAVHFLVLMAFHFMTRGAGAAENAPRRVEVKQHKLDKHSVDSNIDLGGRVAAFFETLYGRDKTVELLGRIVHRANGSQPSPAADANVVDLTGADDPDHGDDGGRILPYGFWKKFMRDDMQQQATKRQQTRLWRALTYYAVRQATGARTPAAMRGMRDRNSYRGNGGASNAEKGRGLGFALLQFFVDHVQRLSGRSDSCLLMKKARDMRQVLVDEEQDENDLPNLEDNAGHCWFMRWRRRFGIVKMVTGMKLKVPWEKVKRRVRVLLGNIFRLRAFWDILYPGTELRFLSLDQKPSWFNNAGHTGTFGKKGGGQPSVKEVFAHTRQRYTILTTVPSWGHCGCDDPPKVALLFKAAAGGTVIKGLRESERLPPWMKVQAQENGSYRSEDMVEALEWMLPDAKTPAESVVVMLDWYSGHLIKEVAKVVRRKGHVLLFHGGGCTPFTQINDTHLHSKLSKILIQLENDWAHMGRIQIYRDGENRIPTMTREEIVSIVATAWQSIDHPHVAQKGYKQTGPAMPLRGPLDVKDVYADLLKVMEELDKTGTALEAGTTIRDNAVAYVKEEREQGRLTNWADCWKLIEEHDGLTEALAEGMESFRGSSDPYDDAEGDGPEDEGEDGDEAGGGDGCGDGPSDDFDLGNDSGSDSSDHGSDGACAGSDGACAEVLGGSKIACDSVVGMAPSQEESNPDIKIVAARQTLFDEAVRINDDAMVRSMRKQMRAATRGQEEASTNIGKWLMQRAKDQYADDAKRRRQAIDEKKLENKTAEETKLATAEKNRQTQVIRLEYLKQVVVNRREADKTKQAAILHKAQQRWLQTQFPVIIAQRCIDVMDKLSKGAKKRWTDQIERLLCGTTFERQVIVIPLWTPDILLTKTWCTTIGLISGTRKQVRMGGYFQELLERVASPTMFGRDPVDSLLRMLRLCVPCANRIFTGNYAPLRLLHLNDYVMEKAFVYGIIALSKWLGEEKFAYGIYGRWPPPFPEGLVPSTQGSTSVHLLDELPDADDAGDLSILDHLALVDDERAMRKLAAAANSAAASSST